MMVSVARALACLGLVVSCGDGKPVEPAAFPPEFRSTYQEVRDCRFSLEHDLMHIRVWASPDAVDVYLNRVGLFPAGAILVKEEFDEDDTECRELVDYTAMIRLPLDSAPADLDWRWQRASPDFAVIEDDVRGCPMCHIDCGAPPAGYEGTCAMPP